MNIIFKKFRAQADCIYLINIHYNHHYHHYHHHYLMEEKKSLASKESSEDRHLRQKKTYVLYCFCLVRVMSGSFDIPWTLAHQASLSMGFPRQRLLEWVVIYFCRRSFWRQGLNPWFLHCKWILYCWATWEALWQSLKYSIKFLTHFARELLNHRSLNLTKQSFHILCNPLASTLVIKSA